MTSPDLPQQATASPVEEAFASARGYLLYIAERQLGPDLHAKVGASDLVQTALLHAHRSARQFQGRSPADCRGWLRRILLNVVHNLRRHWRSRAGAREVPLAEPAHRESPSHLTRQQERRQLLAAALGRLTEEQRLVISLRIDENLPFAEIGQRIGKTADAARMVYNRALEQLQAMMPAGD